jgi:hypothetical protein
VACGSHPGEIGFLLESAEQLFFRVIDYLAHMRVYFHPVFNLTAGVEDRAMVATAKGLADGVERCVGRRLWRKQCCAYGPFTYQITSRITGATMLTKIRRGSTRRQSVESSLPKSSHTQNIWQLCQQSPQSPARPIRGENGASSIISQPPTSATCLLQIFQSSFQTSTVL